MKRRDFLSKLGIGAATLAIAPQMIPKAEKLESSNTVTTTASVTTSTMKGEKSPFIKNCIYYSPSRGQQYLATSEYDLTVITNNWEMAYNSMKHPDDLVMIESAYAEHIRHGRTNS